MKITMDMSVSEAQKVIGKAMADRMPQGVRIEAVEWQRYGDKVTVTATDEPAETTEGGQS